MSHIIIAPIIINATIDARLFGLQLSLVGRLVSLFLIIILILYGRGPKRILYGPLGSLVDRLTTMFDPFPALLSEAIHTMDEIVKTGGLGATIGQD